MLSFFQARAFLSHWLDQVDQHSIHSPYFFDFFQLIRNSTTPNPSLEHIEQTRKRLFADTTELKVVDLGAGSRITNSDQRSIASIARASLSPPQLGRLYLAICQLTKATRILELGTSLGVTSLYLAERKEATVFTFEGSTAIADVALTNFEAHNRKNIKLVVGNIEDTLPEFLQDPAKIQFALLDANHRYEPTLRYFHWVVRRLSEKSIMVIDDIHNSPEMEKAWKELKSNQLVYGSIDLFRCGILFFDPDLNRQHFIL